METEHQIIEKIGLPDTLIKLIGFVLVMFFIYVVAKILNPPVSSKSKLGETHRETLINSLTPIQRFITILVLVVVIGLMSYFLVDLGFRNEQEKIKSVQPQDNIPKESTTIINGDNNGTYNSGNNVQINNNSDSIKK